MLSGMAKQQSTKGGHAIRRQRQRQPQPLSAIQRKMHSFQVSKIEPSTMDPWAMGIKSNTKQQSTKQGHVAAWSRAMVNNHENGNEMAHHHLVGRRSGKRDAELPLSNGSNLIL
jgi:hypothetical protein